MVLVTVAVIYSLIYFEAIGGGLLSPSLDSLIQRSMKEPFLFYFYAIQSLIHSIVVLF